VIALMTVAELAIAIDPEHIESVEQNTDFETCTVRTVSGKEHQIARPYKYVTGIIRAHWEARGED
jgi:hypothetical protein